MTLVGMLFTGFMAVTRDSVYALGFFGLIGLWECICRTRAARDKRIHNGLLDHAFANLIRTKPHLQVSSRYGYPYFTLTFASDEDLTIAERSGQIAAFKSSIQKIYGHVGGGSRPFKANDAVYATVGCKPLR